MNRYHYVTLDMDSCMRCMEAIDKPAKPDSYLAADHTTKTIAALHRAGYRIAHTIGEPGSGGWIVFEKELPNQIPARVQDMIQAEDRKMAKTT